MRNCRCTRLYVFRGFVIFLVLSAMTLTGVALFTDHWIEEMSRPPIQVVVNWQGLWRFCQKGNNGSVCNDLTAKQVTSKK